MALFRWAVGAAAGDPLSPVLWLKADGAFADATQINAVLKTNGVGFVSGYVGQAFDFDGVGDGLFIADAPEIRSAPELTFSFFARRPDPEGEAVVLDKGGDGTALAANYGISFAGTDSGHAFQFYSGGSGRGVDGPNDTLWHHYAVVVTNGAPDPVFYIDGTVQAISRRFGTEGPVNLVDSDAPLVVGGKVLEILRHGRVEVDDLQIYRTGLGPEQVLSLATCPPSLGTCELKGLGGGGTIQIGIGFGGSPFKIGQLTVDFGPTEAVGAGARWRLFGYTNLLTGGASLTLPAESIYLVEFLPAAGFLTPPVQVVSLESGSSLTLLAFYIPDALVVPPHFVGIVRIDDGVRLMLDGSPGVQGRVDSSTDLVHWTTRGYVGMLADGTNSLEFHDGPLESVFYRVERASNP